MKIIALSIVYFISISISICQNSINKTTLLQIKSNVAINKSIDSLRSVFLTIINTTRSNPKQYGINNNLQSERLDTLVPTKPFIINNLLNLKAQSYASKLSFINYKDISFLKHSTMVYSESIVMGTSLTSCFYNFILDNNISDKGHRKHLLVSNDSIIGIGICYIVSLDFYVIVIETDF